MGIQDFGTIGADASLKQVIDVLADLQDTLNFLLNGNLDVKNLRANSVNADRIKANTITADRMDVQQLSAIAADLGTITAGIIYGAYIATSNGTYPRIEFSSADRLLKAFSSATRTLSITPSQGGTPGLIWEDGSIVAYAIAESSIGLFIKTFIGALTLEATTRLELRGNPIELTGNLEINGHTTFTGSFSNGTQTIVVNQGLITGVFP